MTAVLTLHLLVSITLDHQVENAATYAEIQLLITNFCLGTLHLLPPDLPRQGPQEQCRQGDQEGHQAGGALPGPR